MSEAGTLLLTYHSSLLTHRISYLSSRLHLPPTLPILTSPMLNPATAISLAQQHARAGNHAEAERIYRQLLQNSPNNAVAWHNLGMACYLQKRPDEAIEALQKAIEIRGDYVEAINNLGAVLSAQNRVDEAVQVFRKAIEQKPRWVEPMMNIGNTLRNNNRFDEAI